MEKVAALIICLAMLNVAVAQAPHSSELPRDVIIAPRLFGEITKDVRAALRQEATADVDTTEWHAALATLTGLYQEIISHPRMTRKSDLQRTRRVVRSRLLRAHKKLLPDEREAPGPPAAVESIDPPDAVLAQQRGFVAGGQAGGVGAVGGQAGGAAVGGAAAGGPADYGPQLAELIERVVAADIWESAGGPAAIVYHRPSMAMVISAPEDVHEEIRELLTNLRAAGP